MNKYEINTDKKKETIINTALPLFEKNGFRNVTIREIAALAKVSQVSIYNYFGSKESLFSYCIEAVLQDVIAKAREILFKDLDFIQKIQLVSSVCSAELNIALSNQFSENALNDLSLYGLLMEKINQRKREVYREYIEYGKCEGVIDTSLSTNMILEFMEAINMVGGLKEIDEERAKELPQLFHLLLYGLVGKSK